MRRVWFFIGLLLSVVFFLGACAPSTAPQLPPDSEMKHDSYPILPKKHAMTVDEVQKFGLQVGKLKKDTLVFNHYRVLGSKGGWKDEVLPAGTGVAQDAEGRAWYKLDCANRLYVPVPHGPAWWPFGSAGPRWPWWLPWFLLLLPFFGLLGWLLARRQGGGQRPPPPPPENRGGNDHGGDPDLPGPAALRPSVPSRPASAPALDPVATAKATAAGVLGTTPDPKSDGVKTLVARVGKIETDLADVKAELTKLGEAPVTLPAVAPVPPPAPAPPVSSLTLAEAQDLCLRHIRLERRGVRALYARWDSGKISDEEFLIGVEAILAD